MTVVTVSGSASTSSAVTPSPAHQLTKNICQERSAARNQSGPLLICGVSVLASGL
jgi:hypothetical protein